MTVHDHSDVQRTRNFDAAMSRRRSMERKNKSLLNRYSKGTHSRRTQSATEWNEMKAATEEKETHEVEYGQTQ